MNNFVGSKFCKKRVFFRDWQNKKYLQFLYFINSIWIIPVNFTSATFSHEFLAGHWHLAHLHLNKKFIIANIFPKEGHLGNKNFEQKGENCLNGVKKILKGGGFGPIFQEFQSWHFLPNLIFCKLNRKELNK